MENTAKPLLFGKTQTELNPNTWQNFYDDIKDPSWPDCYNETQFYTLPDYIQKEILEIHNGLPYIMAELKDLTTIDSQLPQNNNDIDFVPECNLKFQVGPDFFVYYDWYMNAGGTGYTQSYPKVIKARYPNKKFNNCLEWCAGAGMLGFRLLADGICKNVSLMDCFGPAIAACNFTIDRMPLEFSKHASVIHGSCIKDIPDQMQFDLIVGNPPASTYKKYATVHSPDELRLSADQGLKLHKEFFENIKKNLSPDGVILLQKDIYGSDETDFIEFINNGGLKITGIFQEKLFSNFWYLEIQHS
jgi:hypothetical protein